MEEHDVLAIVLLDGIGGERNPEGYLVRQTANGEEALAAVAEKCPDLVVLDVMMPRKNGLDTCRELRFRHPRMAILMLTARNTDEEVLKGYEVGVDDYVTKPFAMKVLFARISALLRRTQALVKTRRTFSVGRHLVDGDAMTIVDVGGSATPLTAREYELLSALDQYRGMVIGRDRLLDEVWGVTYYGNTRTLDQHVALLRRKLGSDSSFLVTIRNIGYELKA